MEILFSIFLFYISCKYVQVSAFSKRTTESFIIHYLEDRRIIPVRIQINTEKQTEHVSSIGGETLYDFNQGKVAYKDTNSSQCFIADIMEESLEGDRRRLMNLRNGVIRGFYLPTFTIQEELTNETDLLKSFGILLTDFCNGNTISLVTRQKHRKKRDTSGEKGQFTHHSYGHYGHQSNNYAHYGQETYITGAVDKDGQIRNHRVSQNQVRSESSHVYPRPGSRNEPQVSTSDSRMTISSPQSTQHQMPTYQQAFGRNGRNFGNGGSGQFSLQTAHEGGYQLNLPLGLQAGNVYHGRVRTGGHYGTGSPHSQITTGYQKYPDTIHSATYQPSDQIPLRQPLPPVSAVPGLPYPSSISRQAGLIPGHPTKIGDRTVGTIPSGYRDIDQSGLTQRLPGIPGTDTGKIPSLIQPEISVPISSSATGDRRMTTAGAPRTQIYDAHTDSRTFATDSRRQSGTDYESQDRRHVDTRIPSGQVIPTRTNVSESPHISLHPGPSIAAPGLHTPSYQPGVSMPSIRMPGREFQRPSGLPGQILTIPEAPTIGMQPTIGISRPSSQLPSIPSDLRHQQQYVPSSMIPDQQYLQTPGIRYPTRYGTEGTETRPQVPTLYTPGYPSSISTDRSGATHISPPTMISRVPGLSHLPGTFRSFDDTSRDGIRYPQTRTDNGEEYLRRDIPHHTPGISSDSRSPPITSRRPEDGQFLHRGIDSVPPDGYQRPTTLRQSERIPDSLHALSSPRGIGSELIAPDSRRIANGDTGSEVSRLFGQDSASSQTQIQTGFEGTAAEASAAGQHGSLGSQTQVQGGYVGNGSFSAQAQSGFMGGVVQSQVQGSKQGGLSGSSAQVEKVGSAQSQVQVGQPSGSASSSAQGRFSGGVTQVQAQSSKSGGSAGAQAQSTGLSSSHVQVNIGGKDASEQERFHGTVSASVHGSHLSGQSQTQLQGGYNSGRTYVATAQGGFDTSLGFQAAVPPIGSLTRLSNQTFQSGRQQFSAVSDQKPLSTTEGRQLPVVGSHDFVIPTRSDDRQTPQTIGLSSRDQIRDSDSSVYRDRSSTLQDSRPFYTGFPQYQLPSSRITPQQVSLIPSHVGESITRHPSSIEDTQRQLHFLPSSHSAPRHLYPDYQTLTGVPSGTSDRKLVPTKHDFPGYRGYDQRNALSSGIAPSSQQISESGIPRKDDRVIQPAASVPGMITPGFHQEIRESSLHTTGLRQPTTPQDLAAYPLSPIQTSQLSTVQQSNYTAGTPVSYRGLTPQLPGPSVFPQSPHIISPESRYIPSYPPSLGPQLQPGLPVHQIPELPKPSLQPALQRGLYYPPSLLPGQPQISPPSSQMIPSHKRPEEMQVLTRPDSSHYADFKPSIHQPPSMPEHPQIRVEHPQISPMKPQISHTTVEIPTSTIPTPPLTLDATRKEIPGVSEPVRSDCCETLRDLKRRCCGRTPIQDGSSPCCKSSRDDLFDFSSEDDLDETKEPCKIVKAICYIVYKPVGKARVCKPTTTNDC